MHSLTDLYRIGHGPSSSHTIGVGTAAALFKNEHPGATHFHVTLYGSLALTGRGHGTDRVLREILAPAHVEITFDTTTPTPHHPNTFDIAAKVGRSRPGKPAAKVGRSRPGKPVRFYSTGGGAIEREGCESHIADVYPLSSFTAIKSHCARHKLRIHEYALATEGPALHAHLSAVWETMKQSVLNGLKAEGTLPGPLGVHREAGRLFSKHTDARHPEKYKYESPETYENRMVCAYAFAVAEENADGGRVVTAPTCGSCGVVPAVLYHMQKRYGYDDPTIIRALATAGIVGNIVKTNASISGAECGCQAEIGTACSMAAAAIAELQNLSLSRIEYAAEIAMEHHLGLTCDPIAGLVQIPCIERNAVAAMRAINAASLADILSDTRKISFDLVVETMYETGKDLSSHYRETGIGGLAKLYKS